MCRPLIDTTPQAPMTPEPFKGVLLLSDITEPCLLPLTQDVLDRVMGDYSKTFWLPTHQVIALTHAINRKYREGEPVMSDLEWDRYFLGEIQRRNPNDPVLNTRLFF